MKLIIKWSVHWKWLWQSGFPHSWTSTAILHNTFISGCLKALGGFFFFFLMHLSPWGNYREEKTERLLRRATVSWNENFGLSAGTWKARLLTLWSWLLSFVLNNVVLACDCLFVQAIPRSFCLSGVISYPWNWYNLLIHADFLWLKVNQIILTLAFQVSCINTK